MHLKMAVASALNPHTYTVKQQIFSGKHVDITKHSTKVSLSIDISPVIVQLCINRYSHFRLQDCCLVQ